MNYAIIIHIVGTALAAESVFLLLPIIPALIYHETSVALTYLCCSALSLVIGLVMRALSKGNQDVHPKEAMLSVALVWIAMSLMGALPFFLTGEIPSFVDAFFETVSGFTTTGSSILNDVGAVSFGSRFWRSFTHWIGGMGILVFLLAVVPNTGGGFVNLMVAESPGPSVEKLVPKIRDTATYLYGIYIGLTLIQIVLLLIAGMPWFDTVTLTMGTAGTGGFAVRSDGFASYTMLQTGIIAVFMMLFGINFNTYYLLVKGKFRQAFKSEEVITYLVIIAVVTAVIVLSVYPQFDTFLEALHHSFFTVSSIITTTGYSTVDFNLWTPLARTLIVMIMFIGACAGSTGGGIKVSRFNIMAKGIKKEFQTLLHPRSVKKVRMDGKPIKHEVVRSVNVFLSIYIVIFVVSLILISIEGKDLVTNFTAVAATLNNIGPGLGSVGPASSFSEYSDFSKLVLSFDMLAGRLELLPMIFLLMSGFWARKSWNS